MLETWCDFSADADALWRVATDWRSLAVTSRGMISYQDLPDGPFEEGQRITVMLSMFGLGPRFPWVIEIARLDHGAREMRSVEHGGAAKRWNHRIQVVETEVGARLDERLDLDAGAMSPAFAVFARSMYRLRNRRRARLVGAERHCHMARSVR